MKKKNLFYWIFVCIYCFILISFIGELCIDIEVSGKEEPFNFNLSSAHLYWSYLTGEKIRSVAISDDGGQIVASTYSPDSSVYLFDNKPSTSKVPSWIFNNAEESNSINYRATETLYFDEFWYENEYVRAGTQINFSVQSSPSVISFAIWDQPFENLPTTTEYGVNTDAFQLISNSYEYYWIFLRSSSTINYNFNSTGEVNFFICDGYNFYLWNQGLPSSFYVDLQYITSANGSFITPSAQDYYVVWYNEGLSSVFVDYIINYTALNVPDLSVADFHVEAVDFIPQQTFIVPSNGNWYFFIYFDPMNSPEETTNITFDVTYEIGNNMYAVDISASGYYIAAVSDNKYVYYLFNSITNPKEPIWEFKGDNSFNDVAISSDGKYLITATTTGRIYLLNDLLNYPKLPLWNYTIGDVVYSVAISANGDYIAVAGWNGNLYFFNKNSAVPLWIYFSGSKILSVDISLDGNDIIAGTYDGKVLRFNKGSSTPLWSYSTSGTVNTVAVSADGNYYIAGSSDNNLYLFERSSSIPLWYYLAGASFGRSDCPRCIAISQDGKYIAVGTQDSRFYYFERLSSVPLWSHILGGRINAIAMSADGSYVVAGSDDYRIYLFYHEIGVSPFPFPFALILIVTMISGTSAIGVTIALLIRRRKKIKLRSNEPYTVC